MGQTFVLSDIFAKSKVIKIFMFSFHSFKEFLVFCDLILWKLCVNVHLFCRWLSVVVLYHLLKGTSFLASLAYAFCCKSIE